MFSKTPWASKPTTEAKEPKNDEDGESLSTILPKMEDRSSLTLLTMECTELMRQSIIDTFDPSQTAKDDELVTIQDDGQKAQAATQDQANEENQPDKISQKEMNQRQKELNMPKMQELKTAALEHFDAWNSSVIQRVGQVVNSRETGNVPDEKSIPTELPESKVEASSVLPTDPSPYDSEVNKTLRTLHQPVKTPLKELSEGKRVLIMHSMLLLLLSLEHYQAHSRILMLTLLTSLGLPIDVLASDETKVAQGLLTAAERMSADEDNKKRTEEGSSGRTWKVGLAAVAGAALVGVTGGLAAPLLAAGIGTVMGGLGLGATAAAGYLGTLAGSSVLVGALFGAYGGRMTGKMMDKYAKEVEDFAFVPIRTTHGLLKVKPDLRRLRVAIGISGWLTDQNDIVEPWRVIGNEIESFALRWELEALMNLGNAMTTIIKSAAWGLAKREIVRMTVFASLSAGLWPLGMLKVSRVLDNPYSVALYRASKAGDALADALINKAQGERPVTLVGYSLGAKVIFTCLQRLAERKAFGLVESVVLMGTPAASTTADWRRIRSVVSGRVVNVFSTNDYILGFLHRSHSMGAGIAGLQEISVRGVENLDVNDVCRGHTSYRYLTGTILKKIGFEDLDMVEVEREERKLQEKEAQEEKERQESERKENLRKTGNEDVSTVKQEDANDVSDEHVRDIEEEIDRKNRQSYLGWAQERVVAAGSNTAGATTGAYVLSLHFHPAYQQLLTNPPIIDMGGRRISYSQNKRRLPTQKKSPKRPKPMMSLNTLTEVF